MTSTWIYYIITGVVVPIILTIAQRWASNMMMRVDTLEKTAVSEVKVRQIISDKLDPMKEDITEIKEYLKLINQQLFERK